VRVFIGVEEHGGSQPTDGGRDGAGVDVLVAADAGAATFCSDVDAALCDDFESR
jgi:hypothetical protein